MRLSLIYLIAMLFVNAIETNAKESNLTCEDMNKKAWSLLGSLIYYTKSSEVKDVKVLFYLSTKKSRKPVEIDKDNWSGLRKSDFDPTKPIAIVIHGFQSHGTQTWVLDLKEKLLDAMDSNVIVVDWSDGSKIVNYVNAARNTQVVSGKIFNFLQMLRMQVESMAVSSQKYKWNHLYFVGHSLGAQTSGQTAYLLKQDNFWIVDRITGLDPAKPCFIDVDVSLKLDKSDAKFVDVIHTQIGRGEAAFGFEDTIGNIDFYVNGGWQQPKCLIRKPYHILTKVNKMTCSHQLSYEYFTESLVNSNNKTCKYTSYAWDGSYKQAKNFLNDTFENRTCSNCPEMGINASKSGRRGMFLVITSSKTPYCQFKGKEDYDQVAKVLESLEKKSSIFTSNEVDKDDDEIFLSVN